MMTLVFSYAHSDEDLRNELEKHLSPLKRQGRIDTWHDRRIVPGQRFEQEIDEHFASADIVLLLVSADFINSDYCYEREMQRSLERHRRGEAVVLPVILRPCAWHGLPFGELLAATPDGKPIVQYPTLDDGFLEVVNAVTRILDDRGQQRPADDPPESLPAAPSVGGPRSSRLAVRRTFTDRDRDEFVREGFEYLARFFANSLAELENRYPDIDSRFHRRDADAFEATVYRNGDRVAQGGVLVVNDHGGAIRYADGQIPRNSYNENVLVQDDGHSLGFRMTMAEFMGQAQDGLLTAEGLAEALWERLIRPLL